MFIFSWHSYPAKEESIINSPFTTKKNKLFIVHCVLYILIFFLVLVGSKCYIIKTSNNKKNNMNQSPQPRMHRTFYSEDFGLT